MIDMKEEIRKIRWTEGWPLWPRLPMKNYRLVPPGHMPETGFVFSYDVEASKPVVYFENVFIDFSKQALRNVKQVSFDSVEEMVAAGWVGD